MNFDENLWKVYESLLAQFTGITELANALAALGALIYVSMRVFAAMSRGGEIDIFPLLRPFGIGICIVLFHPLVLSPLNAVTEAVNNGVEAVAQRNETEVDRLRERRNQMQSRVRDKRADETAWYDVGGMLANAGNTLWEEFEDGLQNAFITILEWFYFASEIILKTLRIFYLLILAIIGPIVFAFGLFDGISGGIPAWFSRYISISLWASVISILKALLNTVHTHLLNIEIQDLEAVLAGQPGVGTDYYAVAFYLAGILGFFAVPTIAGWIVSAGGGVGAFGSVLNKAAGMATMATGMGLFKTIGTGRGFVKNK